MVLDQVSWKPFLVRMLEPPTPALPDTWLRLSYLRSTCRYSAFATGSRIVPSAPEIPLVRGFAPSSILGWAASSACTFQSTIWHHSAGWNLQFLPFLVEKFPPSAYGTSASHPCAPVCRYWLSSFLTLLGCTTVCYSWRWGPRSHDSANEQSSNWSTVWCYGCEASAVNIHFGFTLLTSFLWWTYEF